MRIPFPAYEKSFGFMVLKSSDMDANVCESCVFIDDMHLGQSRLEFIRICSTNGILAQNNVGKLLTARFWIFAVLYMWYEWKFV